MGDVVARYKRARGANVLHTMGWDAFGLPARNAALENKVHPAKWTYENIANMRVQLKSMGLSLDWTREFATCDPTYYRHEQKMFLDFMRRDWSIARNPGSTGTRSSRPCWPTNRWRTAWAGARARRSNAGSWAQWFFRITAFADELLDALDEMARWPEKVRSMQRNWIGRSEGAFLSFERVSTEGAIEVFTTRHDTIFGATFIALSPDHPAGHGTRR